LIEARRLTRQFESESVSADRVVLVSTTPVAQTKVAVAERGPALLDHGMPPPFTILQNHLGERLDFSFHQAESTNAPTVVLGHGVTGHKDRPLLLAVAASLANHGFNALRFSFAGNGASEGRFEESTLTKEVDELRAVFDTLPTAPVGYIGHSMGAAVGVLHVSKDSRPKFLVSLAGIAHTAAFAQRQFGLLQPGMDRMWDKPDCPLSQAYMDEMQRVGSVVEAARQIHIPWLLIHGNRDDVVPIQDSHDLRAVAPQATWQEVDGADHTFSGDHMARVARDVVRWVSSQSVVSAKS
jgi:pimeloyl-ACP methyl ester carboxylesterase